MTTSPKRVHRSPKPPEEEAIDEAGFEITSREEHPDSCPNDESQSTLIIATLYNSIIVQTSDYLLPIIAGTIHRSE